MTMQQLLFEDFGPVQFQLVESRDGSLVAEGEFGYCDRPTSNGRVYPRTLMEREIGRLREKMKTGGLFGELDHPEDGKTKLQRVAMVIEDMRIESNGRVVGRFRVLEGTPNGDTLAAIVRAGGQVGVSSRGIGSTVTEGNNSVVQDDFRLFTYDAVAEPAVSSALPAFKEGGQSSGGRRARRERDMGESRERYLSDAEVEALIEQQDRLPQTRDLTALMEQVSDMRHDYEGELRAMRAQAAEAQRLLTVARDRLMAEQHEREQLEAELAQMEEEAERLRQSDELSKLTLWQTTADTIINARMPAIHSEHREHFLRLLGKPEPGTSLADLERRVSIQFEEFMRTGRAAELSADAMIEQAELLREARESLIALNEQAERGAVSDDLLQESKLELRRLVAVESEELPRLRRQLKATTEELASLQAAHKQLKREHRRLSEDYAQVSEQVELIEERAASLEEQSKKIGAMDLEIHRLRRSLSAQYPQQMYEHLRSARTKQEIKEEAAAFLRHSRRSAQNDPHERPAQMSGVGSSQQMGLVEERSVMDRLRAMNEARAKREAGQSPIVESDQGQSLHQPSMHGAPTSAWDVPMTDQPNRAVLDTLGRMNRAASNTQRKP